MSTARCAIFNEPRQPLELTELPLPYCGPGDLLVEISLATICASDLHTVDGRRLEPCPSILGHEGVGRVVQAGERRDPSLVGRRISWTVADHCGECRPCREWDLPQKCEHLFKYGHSEITNGCGLNGCYASHILLRPGTTVVPVPEELPDALVSPANCALATMVNATEWLPNPCRVAVIQGAGMLGLFGCALLRARGVARVIVVDTNPARLELVPLFGGIPARQTAGTVLPPGAADAVFEVAGTSAVVPEGVRHLRHGGYYAFVGMVHPTTPLELSGQLVLRRCLTLRGFHNYGPRHLEGAIRFLREHGHTLPVERIVSPPFPLAEINAALAEARKGKWLRVAVKP